MGWFGHSRERRIVKTDDLLYVRTTSCCHLHRDLFIYNVCSVLNFTHYVIIWLWLEQSVSNYQFSVGGVFLFCTELKKR